MPRKHGYLVRKIFIYINRMKLAIWQERADELIRRVGDVAQRKLPTPAEQLPTRAVIVHLPQLDLVR
jgi:hypothetical protein